MRPLSGIARVLPLFMLTAAGWSGEPLKQGDRDFAMSHLHASRKALLDAIDGLSQAQWTYKPAPDRWSIGEVAEHITISEEQLFALMKDKVLPGPEVASGLSRKADEEFMNAIRDRSSKAQAPQEMVPVGRFKSPAGWAEHFKKVRDNTILFIRTTPEPLRHRVFESPMGRMDPYQMLLLIAAHTERHVAQIAEVKAAAGFPKR